MILVEELDKWMKDGTTYVTKFYLKKDYADKKIVELHYKFEKDDKGIQKQVNLEVGLTYNLSKEELDGFLLDSNRKFHKMLADYIEENWEETIFTHNPTNQDVFEIAYYEPAAENAEDNTEISGRVIITKGKRSGDQIISREEDMNAEVLKGTTSIIGWCHK